MNTAIVLGSVNSTLKHTSMVGCKLMVVQPLLADNRSPDGQPVVAADGVGAGRGDRVLITSDGRYARELLKTEKTPLRWTIIGICDE